MALKAILNNLEWKMSFVNQPWWAKFKISFAVSFFGKQIIFWNLNRTLNAPAEQKPNFQLTMA